MIDRAHYSSPSCAAYQFTLDTKDSNAVFDFMTRCCLVFQSIRSVSSWAATAPYFKQCFKRLLTVLTIFSIVDRDEMNIRLMAMLWCWRLVLVSKRGLPVALYKSCQLALSAQLWLDHRHLDWPVLFIRLSVGAHRLDTLHHNND